MSKILIINSSCRPKSNSSILSSYVAKGAKESGHTVESIEIGSLQIAPCRGCLGCMKPESNFCVIKDDMHQFYKQIVQADVLIFCSPIYWFNLGGQLKQFIDRCYAVALSPKLKQPFASKKNRGSAHLWRLRPLELGLRKRRVFLSRYLHLHQSNMAGRRLWICLPRRGNYK